MATQRTARLLAAVEIGSRCEFTPVTGGRCESPAGGALVDPAGEAVAVYCAPCADRTIDEYATKLGEAWRFVLP